MNYMTVLQGAIAAREREAETFEMRQQQFEATSEVTRQLHELSQLVPNRDPGEPDQPQRRQPGWLQAVSAPVQEARDDYLVPIPPPQDVNRVHELEKIRQMMTADVNHYASGTSKYQQGDIVEGGNEWVGQGSNTGELYPVFGRDPYKFERQDDMAMQQLGSNSSDARGAAWRKKSEFHTRSSGLDFQINGGMGCAGTTDAVLRPALQLRQDTGVTMQNGRRAADSTERRPASWMNLQARSDNSAPLQLDATLLSEQPKAALLGTSKFRADGSTWQAKRATLADVQHTTDQIQQAAARFRDDSIAGMHPSIAAHAGNTIMQTQTPHAPVLHLKPDAGVNSYQHRAASQRAQGEAPAEIGHGTRFKRVVIPQSKGQLAARSEIGAAPVIAPMKAKSQERVMPDRALLSIQPKENANARSSMTASHMQQPRRKVVKVQLPTLQRPTVQAPGAMPARPSVGVIAPPKKKVTFGTPSFRAGNITGTPQKRLAQMAAITFS